jgi:NitT/TauT family transport system permease protein
MSASSDQPRLRRERKLSIVLVMLILLAWETAARAGWISALFFPPPSEILSTAYTLTVSGELIRHTAMTINRLLLGLVLGGLPGLLLGLLMGWSHRLRAVLDPLISAIHPLPKIALLPLILIIFGIGETSKVVIAALGAFFPMVISTSAGVAAIPPVYFEVAENYGANRRQVFRVVVLPASLPSSATGFRLAFNLTLLLTIAAEIISARVGLGALIWLSWETMRTTHLYASLLIIALLGVGSTWLLQRIYHRLVPWHVER